MFTWDINQTMSEVTHLSYRDCESSWFSTMEFSIAPTRWVSL